MADADTIYRVLTVYDADTSKADRGVSNMASGLDHLVNLSEKAIRFVEGLVESIIHVGSEAEKATISIAGLFSATGLSFGHDFRTSMQMSTQILSEMREEASKLPGTFDELQSIFQRMLPGGANAGRSAEDIKKMSEQMMAVGKTFGMNAEFIGREAAEMMEGRVSRRVTLFAKLRQFMGPDMDSTKFNALGAAEQWNKISEALTKFNPMIKEYAGSWVAIETTTETYFQNIMRFASAGIFEMLKGDLDDLNNWYKANEQQILAVAKAVFTDLGGAIKFVIGMIRESAQQVLDWIQFFGLAKDQSEAVRLLADGVGILAGVITGIIVLTTAWKVAQWALNFAFLANPIGIVILSIAALAGAIVVAISQIEKFHDVWTIMANDPALRKVADKMGMGIFMGEADPAKARAAEQRMVDREVSHIMTYGSGGLGGDIKAMLDRNGLLPGSPAVAGGNIRNPMSMLQMLPGMGVLANAGAPDIAGLLNHAGKPVEVHNTSIGSINLYNNIYDAEDPARVIVHLTQKAVRDNVERPNQSPGAFVGR